MRFTTLAFYYLLAALGSIVSPICATPLGARDAILFTNNERGLQSNGDIPSKDRLRVVWTLDINAPRTPNAASSETTITTAILTAAKKGYFGPKLKSYDYTVQFPMAPAPQYVEKKIGKKTQRWMEFIVEQGDKVLVSKGRVVDGQGVADFMVRDEGGKETRHAFTFDAAADGL
ncbi:hypothetical protein GYMLUDRAFT_43872 [Collybiopsis luxurians FD-317 M1]|uniref:Uncharacterized protein n=1 Tax=Collybiopsis luxurians FD-317 M1 TaxID=944289 RepID=A0A0D0B956_9AGAR|nr:hypothetical protein GYMLUDRAFT_43872 [Collybiopsis luxurians FD-317 M1]